MAELGCIGALAEPQVGLQAWAALCSGMNSLYVVSFFVGSVLLGIRASSSIDRLVLKRGSRGGLADLRGSLASGPASERRGAASGATDITRGLGDAGCTWSCQLQANQGPTFVIFVRGGSQIGTAREF